MIEKGAPVSDVDFTLVVACEKNVETNLDMLLAAAWDPIDVQKILEAATNEHNVRGFKHVMQHFPLDDVDYRDLWDAAGYKDYREIRDAVLAQSGYGIDELAHKDLDPTWRYRLHGKFPNIFPADF
jgi:hypothetical protein